MSHPVRANRVQSLDISLNGTAVGTLIRTPGGYHAFSLAESYRSAASRPILSQSLLSATGGLVKDPRPTAVHLPPLFANMLPEGKLREAMEKHHGATVRPGNDFDLMTALGRDLPGAAMAIPSDAGDLEVRGAATDRRARFSLAGVQMKMSVMRNAGKGGGVAVALDNEEGHFIAKFPSLIYPALSENEFAMLALAEAIGMDVPQRELVSDTEFSGIPAEFSGLAKGKVLLVKRFDRGPGDARIHIEDMTQVFGLYPGDKYKGASSQNVATAISRAVSLDAAIEFVRRLAFSAMVGNGDMHLKNWSLIYPGDGTKAALAPVYDFVSTVPYIPNDAMALTIAGEKQFGRLTIEQWRRFARKAALPEGAVVDAVEETSQAMRDAWKTLPERDVVPEEVLQRIDAHMERQLAVLDISADATPSP